MRNQIFAYAKTKAQISCAVTAQLISAFVFATLIVLFLYFLSPNFSASSHLLCLYRSVCVGPVLKPHCWFSHDVPHACVVIQKQYVRSRKMSRAGENWSSGFPNRSDRHRSRLEACNFGLKKKRNCTIHVAKTKALISFAVTAKLICAFVFA